MSVEHLGAGGKSVLPAMHCISLAKAGRPKFFAAFWIGQVLADQAYCKVGKRKDRHAGYSLQADPQHGLVTLLIDVEGSSDGSAELIFLYYLSQPPDRRRSIAPYRKKAAR